MRKCGCAKIIQCCLGKAFEELSKLLKDDDGKETILYYLRKDMQGEKLHDIEKEELQSLIQRINVVLAQIKAYKNR